MRLGLAGGVAFPRIPGCEAVGVVAECPGGEFAEGQPRGVVEFQIGYLFPQRSKAGQAGQKNRRLCVVGFGENVFGAVEAVLQGGGLHVAHRSNVTAVSYGPAVGPPVSALGSHTSVGNPHVAFTGYGWGCVE